MLPVVTAYPRTMEAGHIGGNPQQYGDGVPLRMEALQPPSMLQNRGQN